jgi:diguanylate cyclase (GGDEF)-like protein
MRGEAGREMDVIQNSRRSQKCARLLIVYISLALISIVSAYGLDPAKAVSQYIQTTWNSESGLPQNSVHAIAQDREGFIWLGTEEGLARFDGVRFKVFNTRNTPGILSDFIQSFAASRDGSLWVGTDSGLNHFVPSAGATRLSLANNLICGSFTSKNGLSGDWVRALHEDKDGTLWVGTSSGLSLVRGSRVVGSQRELAGVAVNALASDAQGRIWAGTDRGLFEVDYGHFVDWSKKAPVNQEIMALAVVPDGSLWLGTISGGLVHFKDGFLLPVPALPAKEIAALRMDRDGALWISFQRHGIGRLFLGSFSFYDANHGLPSNRVTHGLFEDSEGNLWIGFIDAGFAQLRDGKFAVFGTREGLAGNYVGNLLQSRDGTMWIGTDSNGLNHLLPNGRIELWDEARGLPDRAAFSMLEDRDGDMWVGFRTGGLAQIHHGRVRVYRDPRARHISVNALYEDHAGGLWIGYYGAGVARFKDGRFEHLTTTGRIPAITQSPDGSLWWAADDEGVVQFSHGTRRKFTVSDGLPSNHAMCIYADLEGDIWIGTASGGLSRIRKGQVTSWTPEQGLPEATVGSIIEDNHEHLWLGGNAGIYSLSKLELDSSVPSRITAYQAFGTADGLRSRETVYGGMPSVWKDTAGRLWFATVSGAAVVDPEHLKFAAAPPVRIETLVIDGRSLPLRDGETLGPVAKTIEIGFTSPFFTAPLNVRFRYKLSGFDRDWIDAGDRRRAWYTNLPPGSYTFSVQAANSDGVWNTDGGSFRFVLRPPLARTPLAYAAYLLLTILTGWAALVLRTKALVRRQEELRRIVSERTAQLEDEKRALEAARRELHTRATHDALAGAFNRAAILEHLSREVDRATRDKATLGVLIADLDFFKQVNDRYGHLCGDDVIREAAARLQNAIRKYDFLGRYGGEEFLILFPGWDPELASCRIDGLLDSIRSRPFTTGAHSIPMTCSIGISVYRPEVDSAESRELLSRADEALYAAKHHGRNCARLDDRLPEPSCAAQTLRLGDKR